MKKLVAIILTLFMLIAMLSGCGTGPSSDETGNTPGTTDNAGADTERGENNETDATVEAGSSQGSVTEGKTEDKNEGESEETCKNHVYDNDCDAVCNACGAYRVPSDHVFVNDCADACASCGESRIPTHTYSNGCDPECDVCGSKRETAHAYSYVCDAFCDACGAEREVEHVGFYTRWYRTCFCGYDRYADCQETYDNDCDSLCNDCGRPRRAKHNFANVCDEVCDDCGATRTVDHVYDNRCDAICNECGYERDADHFYETAKSELCRECGYNRVEGHTHHYPLPCSEYCDICYEWRSDPEEEHKLYYRDGVMTCIRCYNIPAHNDASFCTYTSECDEACNECGRYRDTAADHVYDDERDEICNSCEGERWIPNYVKCDHYFWSPCDVKCAYCYYDRGIEHIFDDEYDYFCNREGCGYTYIIFPHICEYDYECSGKCVICTRYTRSTKHYYGEEEGEAVEDGAVCVYCGHVKGGTADVETGSRCYHEYDNDCDAICNECGEGRVVSDHTYASACDADCNSCGVQRNVPPHSDADNDYRCDTCGIQTNLPAAVQQKILNFVTYFNTQLLHAEENFNGFYGLNYRNLRKNIGSVRFSNMKTEGNYLGGESYGYNNYTDICIYDDAVVYTIDPDEFDQFGGSATSVVYFDRGDYEFQFVHFEGDSEYASMSVFSPYCEVSELLPLMKISHVTWDQDRDVYIVDGNYWSELNAAWYDAAPDRLMELFSFDGITHVSMSNYVPFQDRGSYSVEFDLDSEGVAGFNIVLTDNSTKDLILYHDYERNGREFSIVWETYPCFYNEDTTKMHVTVAEDRATCWFWEDNKYLGEIQEQTTTVDLEWNIGSLPAGIISADRIATADEIYSKTAGLAEKYHGDFTPVGDYEIECTVQVYDEESEFIIEFGIAYESYDPDGEVVEESAWYSIRRWEYSPDHDLIPEEYLWGCQAEIDFENMTIKIVKHRHD